MSGFVVCRANEVLVISGCFKDKPSIVTDGTVFVIPGLQKVQRLSLNTFTLKPVAKKQRSKDRIYITVEATVQIKMFPNNVELLASAAEMFMTKTKEDIETALTQSIEGHMGSIIAGFTAEEVQKDRNSFNKAVRELVAQDFVYMGLHVISVTTDMVTDDEGYYVKSGVAKLEETRRQHEAEGNFDSHVCKFEKKRKEFEAQQNKDLSNDIKDIQLEEKKSLSDRVEIMYTFTDDLVVGDMHKGVDCSSN